MNPQCWLLGVHRVGRKQPSGKRTFNHQYLQIFYSDVLAEALLRFLLWSVTFQWVVYGFVLLKLRMILF